jgi:hypothetical protein
VNVNERVVDELIHQAERNAENQTWDVGVRAAWCMEFEKLMIRVTRALYRP